MQQLIKAFPDWEYADAIGGRNNCLYLEWKDFATFNLDLQQHTWTLGFRCKDRGDKQAAILLPRKMMLEGVLLCSLSWERKFSSTAACVSFSHGSSLQEFQEQVSNFLLLSCLGWDGEQ